MNYFELKSKIEREKLLDLQPMEYILAVCESFGRAVQASDWNRSGLLTLMQAFDPYVRPMLSQFNLILTTYKPADEQKAAIIKHDLRKPLARVVSTASLFTEADLFPDLEDEENMALINSIVDNSAEVVRLIRGIMESGETSSEVLNIDLMLSAIYKGSYSEYINRELNPKMKFEIKITLDGSVKNNPEVMPCDSPFIVARNIKELVINSAKYGAQNVEIYGVFISGDKLVFRVTDDGIGMDSGRLAVVNAALKDEKIESVGAKKGHEDTSTGKGLIASRSPYYDLVFSSVEGEGTVATATVSLAQPFGFQREA